MAVQMVPAGRLFRPDHSHFHLNRHSGSGLGQVGMGHGVSGADRPSGARQAHATGLERRQPDRLERRQELVGRVCPGPAADEGRTRDGGLGAQRAQGGLAMGAEEYDQLADPLGLVGTPGTEVAPALLGEDLLMGVLAHWGVPDSVTPPF